MSFFSFFLLLLFFVLSNSRVSPTFLPRANKKNRSLIKGAKSTSRIRRERQLAFFPSPFFRFFNLRPFAFCFPPFPNSATRAVAKSSPRPPTGAPDPLFFRQYKNNNTTPGRERPQKRSEAREKERERAAAPPHRKCSSSFCSTFFFEEKKKR